METSLHEVVTLTRITCSQCSVVFAIPSEMVENRRRDGATFYCPNGHGQVYRVTTEQKLRDKLEFAEKRIGWAENEKKRLAQELQSQKFKTMAERSAKARLKKRIANGVCPCCHRSFSNLRNHLAHMHPEFIEGEKH